MMQRHLATLSRTSRWSKRWEGDDCIDAGVGQPMQEWGMGECVVNSVVRVRMKTDAVVGMQPLLEKRAIPAPSHSPT